MLWLDCSLQYQQFLQWLTFRRKKRKLDTFLFVSSCNLIILTFLVILIYHIPQPTKLIIKISILTNMVTTKSKTFQAFFQKRKKLDSHIRSISKIKISKMNQAATSRVSFIGHSLVLEDSSSSVRVEQRMSKG